LVTTRVARAANAASMISGTRFHATLLTRPSAGSSPGRRCSGSEVARRGPRSLDYGVGTRGRSPTRLRPQVSCRSATRATRPPPCRAAPGLVR
jgi:hypothetical protein